MNRLVCPFQMKIVNNGQVKKEFNREKKEICYANFRDIENVFLTCVLTSVYLIFL